MAQKRSKKGNVRKDEKERKMDFDEFFKDPIAVEFKKEQERLAHKHKIDFNKEERKRKRLYDKMRKAKEEAGEDVSNLEPFVPRTYVPYEEKEYVDDFNRDAVLTSGEAQDFLEIIGAEGKNLNASLWLSDQIGAERFESQRMKAIRDVEVFKNPEDVATKAKKNMAKESAEEKFKNQRRLALRYPKNEAIQKNLELTNKLKAMSLDHWITLVALSFRGTMNAVASIDLDIKRIAYSSSSFVDRGVSTIMQLETIIDLREQKEMLLNVYVLNKMFMALADNDQERMIYLVVMTKIISTNYYEGAKLRALYRGRREMTRRCREFLLRRGYDEEWFFNHFAFVPFIRFVAEHAPIDRRVREIDLKFYGGSKVAQRKHQEYLEKQKNASFVEKNQPTE